MINFKANSRIPLDDTPAKAETHDDHFPQNATDEEWLSVAGEYGFSPQNLLNGANTIHRMSSQNHAMAVTPIRFTPLRALELVLYVA
ncbi:MAG: hypothetical protein ACREUU_09445, partial [Gammaproteobacteria bacterium]